MESTIIEILKRAGFSLGEIVLSVGALLFWRAYVVVRRELAELHRWHQPVHTESGDYFPWKTNYELLQRLDALINRVDKIVDLYDRSMVQQTETHAKVSKIDVKIDEIKSRVDRVLKSA